MQQKIEKLKKHIKSLKSAVIAFSGGVDSSLLAQAAYEVLGKKAVAATAVSDLVSRQEIKRSREVADAIGIKHHLLPLNLLADPRISSNSVRRCYWCKREIFKAMIKLQQQLGLEAVLEGSIAEDLNCYRPGIQALRELKILSPLADLGFNKAEVRQCARLWGLPNYGLASSACLATRLPYGHKLEKGILKRIGAAESYLKTLGFDPVRVRYHAPMARIELNPEQLPLVFTRGLEEPIYSRLKSLGFDYITLDLKGFRSGSMDKDV
ncbi:MAG: ATP-dependent sacrificial sulfur transferase LarE [Actinomycetota bacterium]|nr:ATP-dependent sacrificial sulfur transferase LarE [Actinomycetota bacterium]